MIASAKPIELEALVADALREAGVDVLTTSPRDQEADLAIWSDALQPFVGNPLLVEIKARLQGQRAVADAAQQLAKYVTAAGGLWGLLLYGAGAGGGAVASAQYSSPSNPDSIHPSPRSGTLVPAIDQARVQ